MAKKKKRILLKIALIFGVIGPLLLFSPFLIYKGLYWYEISRLPHEPTPKYKTQLSSMILDNFWMVLEFEGPRRMKPMNFRDAIRIFNKHKYHGYPYSPGGWVASQAASIIIADNITQHGFKFKTNDDMSERHLHNLAVTIWISHHWTIDEALGTIIEASYYGHNTYGLKEAAKLYFNKSHDTLNEEEVLLLAVINYRVYSDPWCNPKRTLQRLNYLKERKGQLPAETLPASLTEAPEGVCESS